MATDDPIRLPMLGFEHHIPERKEDMAKDCGEASTCKFDATMEFQFAQLADRSRHSGQRLSDQNDFISGQAQIGYMEEGKKVGTREAAAMQRMDTQRTMLPPATGGP